MLTLSELAKHLGAPFVGNPDLPLTHLCGFEDLTEGGVAYVSEPGSLAALPTPQGVFSQAKKHLSSLDKRIPCALIVPEGTQAEGYQLIFTPDPLAAHVQAHQWLAPAPQTSGQISPAAQVDPSAKLGPNVTLDPGVVVYPGVEIGANTVIRANSVLMDRVKVGQDCLIYPNVTIREDCQLGDQVILHPGVVIGADGYGYFQREGRNLKIPQIGRVVLEDQVEIGANSCVDRARFTQTKIGAGTKLDNLVHIAHNVEVGPHSLITAQSGIAGSTKTGSHLMMGGQSGIRDNLTLGHHVTLLARTLVTGKAQDGDTLAGMPSRPYSKWRHFQALLGQLESLLERMKKIETFLQGLGYKKSRSNQ